jgi:hypothetical protein
VSSFALVTEGITDQIALETILNEFYDKNLDIRPIQPIRDATDESRQQDFGGWEQVLEYCSLPDFENSLLFNDYVVIQIDTDCGDHVNYGVALTAQGKDKAQADIIKDVINLLITKIGDDIYNENKERILFAIAVHSLECWFLPLFETSKSKQSRTKNCREHLERAVNKENLIYQKDYAVYKNLSKKFKSKNAIHNCRNSCESFDIFIKALPEI